MSSCKGSKPNKHFVLNYVEMLTAGQTWWKRPGILKVYKRKKPVNPGFVYI